jgi:hypothetical protein
MRRTLEVVGGLLLGAFAIFNLWAVVQQVFLASWWAELGRSEIGTSILLTALGISAGLVAIRLGRPVSRPPVGLLSGRDWRILLITTATIAAAVAVGGHWILALPLLPVVGTVGWLGIRKARREAAQFSSELDAA